MADVYIQNHIKKSIQSIIISKFHTIRPTLKKFYLF